MKFTSFVGSAVIYAAGIGTGLCLCYKAVKLLAKIACDESKAEKAKRDRVVPFVSSEHKTECGTALFATRRSAEEALEKLKNLVYTYGFATTADLHHLAYFKDFEGDDSRGWKDLSNAEVTRATDLYRLRLGKPVEIDI